MRRIKEVRARVVEHPAPAGRRRWQSQTQKTERRFRQNGSRHADGRLDNDGLKDVGQDVTGKDAQIRGAKSARGLDKLPLFDCQHLGSHQARVTHPSANSQGKDQVKQPGAQKSHEGDGQKNAREGKKGIHDKDIEQRIHPSAIETGEAAENQSQGKRETNDAHGNHQREARTRENAGEDVAAELVGAKPVGMRRRSEAVIEVDGGGIVRRNGRRQHRDDDEEHEEKNANHSEWLVAEGASKGHRWSSSHIGPVTLVHQHAYYSAPGGLNTMGENAMRKRHWLSTMVLGGTMAALPVLAQQPAEQQVMDLANADRAQQGLPPLKWDPALAQAATQHAQLMAQQPALSHQYPGEPDLDARAGSAGAHFRAIAENVALAPSPQALNQEWMHSPPHRANILDPRMDTIGVGLVQRGGNYYAVEDFASTVAELGPQQIEQKIGQLLQQRGLQPAGLTQEARQTCEMDHGSAGGPKPWFVMRWTGTDLGRLPDELEQRISTGKYHKAAVGACGNPGQGFTTYKIAVMLYQ
jgi:hypothetical protein